MDEQEKRDKLEAKIYLKSLPKESLREKLSLYFWALKCSLYFVFLVFLFCIIFFVIPLVIGSL